jgi:hypothetical protein
MMIDCRKCIKENPDIACAKSMMDYMRMRLKNECHYFK